MRGAPQDVIGLPTSGTATSESAALLDIRPTITIRQGMPFNVYLTTDLVFDGPYARPHADATAFR